MHVLGSPGGQQLQLWWQRQALSWTMRQNGRERGAAKCYPSATKPGVQLLVERL